MNDVGSFGDSVASDLLLSGNESQLPSSSRNASQFSDKEGSVNAVSD